MLKLYASRLRAHCMTDTITGLSKHVQHLSCAEASLAVTWTANKGYKVRLDILCRFILFTRGLLVAYRGIMSPRVCLWPALKLVQAAPVHMTDVLETTCDAHTAGSKTVYCLLHRRRPRALLNPRHCLCILLQPCNSLRTQSNTVLSRLQSGSSGVLVWLVSESRVLRSLCRWVHLSTWRCSKTTIVCDCPVAVVECVQVGAVVAA